MYIAQLLPSGNALLCQLLKSQNVVFVCDSADENERE